MRDPKSLNKWSYNSAVFIERCREAIEKVRADAVASLRSKQKVEANEQPLTSLDWLSTPLEGGNGKRRLQMDKKLNTWLVEADGTRKAISCREIAMQFDSFEGAVDAPSDEKGIIKQLRAGIECGADISTVELDD